MIDLPGMMTMEARVSEEDLSMLSQQSPPSQRQSFNRLNRLKSFHKYEPPFESDSYSSLERFVRPVQQEEVKNAPAELELSKDNESAYSFDS